MRFVQRLPIPYWLTYFALCILHGTFNNVFDWVNGDLPAFTFHSYHFTYPIWLWAPLAFMTYLNSTAQAAVSNFSPLLKLPPKAIQRLQYEFTTMPARGVIISGFVLTGLFIPYAYLNHPTIAARGVVSTPGIVYTILDGWVSFVIGFVFFYYTIRQLRLVHNTVKLVKQFDMFHLDQVYAFSILTSRIGGVYVLWVILTLLVVPLSFSGPIIAVALLSLVFVLSLSAFVLPLWIVHQRLVVEKRRLLTEHGQRVKSTLVRLHHCVDKNVLDDVHHLNNVLDGLKAENSILQKIRTWPWSTETLTGFISTIILPIILLLIQIIIQNWLI